MAWRCTAGSASPARCAGRRCSESATPRTRRTTAPRVRRGAGSWPTARCRGCSSRIGRARWMSGKRGWLASGVARLLAGARPAVDLSARPMSTTAPPPASGPEPVRYERLFSVAPNDIDDRGHVNNVVYLRWVQEVAAAHWEAAAAPQEHAHTAWVVLRHANR